MSNNILLTNINDLIDKARNYTSNGNYYLSHELYNSIIEDIDFFINTLAEESQKDEWEKVFYFNLVKIISC